MADHNPPYLFELDGNKDPEELFEVGALQQAVIQGNNIVSIVFPVDE